MKKILLLLIATISLSASAQFGSCRLPIDSSCAILTSIPTGSTDTIWKVRGNIHALKRSYFRLFVETVRFDRMASTYNTVAQQAYIGLSSNGTFAPVSKDTLIKQLNIQSNWTQSNTDAYDYINNKPTIYTFTGSSGQYTKGDGTYGTLPTAKKQETFSGTTNASGNYTVTFGTPYAVAPNIQANIVGGNALQRSVITSVTTTGFTVNVVQQNTNTLLGIINLVSSTSNVNGASVDVLISEK